MSKLAGKTILIVDDEPELRAAIADEFELAGCKVLQAASGREAFLMTDHHTIDIVLSDIRMPNGDGVELLKDIRKKYPGIPLVAMATGFTEHRTDTLKNLGAIDVFKNRSICKRCSTF